MKIEQNQRLSQSLLWELQESTYKNFNITAWTENGVPFYLTSNPYTASLYAKVAYAYVLDSFQMGIVDPNEPIYFFDLGAGTGRFSYLFLRHLLQLMEKKPFKFSLVLTDIVPETIEFWKNHPKLKPYFENGMCDAVSYHHLDTKPLIENTQNPIILIANYYFDTIPQDYFRITKGKLEEGLINLEVDNENTPPVINDLRYSYTYRPILNLKEYCNHDSQQETLLNDYLKQFEDACFLYPTGAIRSLEYFRELSDHFLLIAGDQGVAIKEQVENWGEPKMAQHGSFSLPVSYHLLQNYFKLSGGKAFLTDHPDPAFINMVAVSNGDDYPETTKVFNEQFKVFEPTEYWRLSESTPDDSDLQTILSLIRKGEGDPINFHIFYPSIERQLVSASSEQKQELIELIDLTWENFFPIAPQEGNFIMNLGVLLFHMKEYEKALLFFERAKAHSGITPQLLSNIRICKSHLN